MIVIWTQFIPRTKKRHSKMMAYSDLEDKTGDEPTNHLDDCTIFIFDYSYAHNRDDNHKFMAQAFASFIKNHNPISGGMKEFAGNRRRWTVRETT